ncbi:uncharacterized protein FOMMEDRAFT_140298 [Fomitiporia mediterranea MF3/22]|uniref:uncharacterized protein n=1 Tax=Fomitiporia mediterranea (strain MF3/22) TaxID=694068 RepID=UPI0004407EDB|nr:uncharacterized protein FOMMEDRAFT_140298 [Fomitiporia mediterranea MF3/22]EJD04295.1 hypothetical protein FOMMEDRAFT_140298 [Fomitiporia mediterranea MF3/22]
MRPSFHPVLGSHTLVPAESAVVQCQDGMGATFTAHLSQEEYEEALASGVRIEVWTNIPIDSQSGSEWNAIAFEEVVQATDAQDAEKNESQLLFNATIGTKCPSPVFDQAHVYHASISLPWVPGRVYAFTYRLVYPSGICWLGSDRDNGLLELTVGNAFFDEIGPWESNEGKRVLAEESSERLTESDEAVLIGRLNTEEWTWSGWATDGSRVWSLSDTRLEHVQNARLAFLIPDTSASSVLVPQIHILRTRSGKAPFSITCDGHVFLHSYRQSAAIEYRVHNSIHGNGIEHLRDDILSSCLAPQIFHTKDTSMILFTADGDSDTSVTIHVQPLTSTPFSRRSIVLPIDTLGSFAKHSPILSLFDSETRHTLFVDRFECPRKVVLKVGASGARVVVSAVYDLTDNSNSASANWKISVPEVNARPDRSVVPGSAENPLPTPPASPQAKPQRSVSFVLPAETDTSDTVRQRRRAERSAGTSEINSASWGLLRSESAFERFHAASGSDKIRVLLFNALRILARFMGIAVLRFILLALRLIGGGKQPEANLPQVGDARDERHTASSPRNDSNYGDAAEGEASSVDSEGDACFRDNTSVEEPSSVHNRSAHTTEAPAGGQSIQEHPMSGTPAIGPVSTTLRWVLPARSATPIRLLVRSDATPEQVSKHLAIELNGEDVGAPGLSMSYAVDERTSVIEVSPPKRLVESSTLLVGLRA